MNRRAVVATLCLLVAACSKQEPDAVEVPAAESSNVRHVDVDPALLAAGRITLGKVGRDSPKGEVHATGYVEADLGGAADVGALVAARVRSVHVREGDRVKRGQLLAELTAPDAARVAGELGRARAERSRAEQVLQREKRLIVDRATTRGELERAETELRGLEAEVRAARQLMSAYGASGARLTVRAPIAGVVTHRGVDIGALVQTGSRLFRIVDPDQLLVRAEVLDRDAHRVHVNDQVFLAFPGDKSCSGRVKSRSVEVEPERRTVSILITPDACEFSIAGQTLDVRIRSAQPQDQLQLAVPRDAVVDLDGAPAVFASTDVPGRFEVVPVVVEQRTQTQAFLLQGPKAGTQVAVRGTILLKGEWMRSSLE